MKLILTRHGHTVWNAEYRVQGQTDIPLDSRGYAQAEALSARLANVKIAAVYTSPLRRAYDTAMQIVCRQGCPVVREEQLIERNFGDWEGRRLQDLSQAYPALWEKWVNAPWECNIPHAESIAEVYKRSVACVKELMKRHPDDTIMIVSHVNPVKLLISYCIGADCNAMHRIRTDNCSYTELGCRDGKLILNTCNETLFLQESGLL